MAYNIFHILMRIMPFLPLFVCGHFFRRLEIGALASFEGDGPLHCRHPLRNHGLYAPKLLDTQNATSPYLEKTMA